MPDVITEAKIASHDVLQKTYISQEAGREMYGCLALITAEARRKRRSRLEVGRDGTITCRRGIGKNGDHIRENSAHYERM